MAKATHESTTTRRRFLTAAPVAAVALSTMSSSSALASADAALLAIEPAIEEIVSRQKSAQAELRRTAKMVRQWLQRNPEPKYLSAIWNERAGDDPTEFHLRKRSWRLRHEAVYAKSGCKAAKHHLEAVDLELTDALARCTLLMAVSLDGCRCKARIANATACEDLAWSIVDDLAPMAEGA